MSVSVTTKWQRSGRQGRAGEERSRSGLWRQMGRDGTFPREILPVHLLWAEGALAALPAITLCRRLQLPFPSLINILACFFLWWYYKQDSPCQIKYLLIDGFFLKELLGRNNMDTQEMKYGACSRKIISATGYWGKGMNTLWRSNLVRMTTLLLWCIHWKKMA